MRSCGTLHSGRKLCVQAVEKLCRGEFSTNPRITSFLSTVIQYQINVQHVSGSANMLSDFASRNAAVCEEPRCQVCTCIVQMEEAVVRTIHDYKSYEEYVLTLDQARGHQQNK